MFEGAPLLQDRERWYLISLTHGPPIHPPLQSENRQMSVSVGQNRSLCGADFKLMEANLC